MSQKISTIKNPEDFVRLLQSPSIHTTLVFLPEGYTIIDEKEFSKIQNITDRIVYADVKVNSQIAFHPSFTPEVIDTNFQFISPIVYTGNQPLQVDGSQIKNISDLIKQLLRQIPGHHIASPIYEFNSPKPQA